MGRGYKLNSSLELFPGGAVLLRDSNTLVVADLHLGREAVMESEGVSIPRLQTRMIQESLVESLRSVRPDRLVIAGDLKHSFSRSFEQEWEDVRRFASGISALVPLVTVRGNHDNYLASILSGLDVPLVLDAEFEGIRVTHGHRGAPPSTPTVIGHLHPSVWLRDRVGASVKERCFLYSERDQMLILPALSLVASGLDVVGQPDADRYSPLLPEDGVAEFVPIVFAEGRPLKFPSVGRLRAMRSVD